MRVLVHHLIEEQAKIDGAAPALTYRDRTLTYDDLWHSVNAAADGLRRLGLAVGDRVGVYLEKRFETVAAIFGTSLAHGVFVPVNPVLKPAQVAHIVNDCDVRILVTTADRLASLAGEIAAAPALHHVILVGDTGAPSGAPPGPLGTVDVLTWSELCAVGALPLAEPSPGRSGIDADMAAILYTSGSTGAPKGVVLSHRNIIVGAESVATYLDNRPSDVILAALPISFDAGFSQLTTAFASGAHVVLINYLLPADVVKTCARHGVTGLTCVPPLWIQLAERTWPPESVASMRYFANTGGRMPRATLDALRSIFPAAAPYLMYGLTEAFRSTYLDPSQVDLRPSSIGRAIPNAEILVVRPDGSPCGPGEEGELVHRGALVALGYWNDPERTAERFRPVPGSPTWRQPELAVWSGDTVVTDDEGYLYFVGRRDDMIKTSGYRVSPTEIEEAAYDTGLVRDAVAIGADDERLGQRIVLVVTGTGASPVDVERLRTEMRQRLALYMVPTTIVEHHDIPRSPNGKFDRKSVAAMIETEG